MKRFLLMGLAILLFVAQAAFSRQQTIQYDDGDSTTFAYVEGLAAGDIESARFTAFAPCHVESLIFYFGEKPGDVEVHVWGDDGSGLPDVSNDLTAPVTITSGDSGLRTTVRLEPELDIASPGEFHVGYVKLSADPALRTDKTPNNLWRSQSRKDGSWQANETGDYLIRVKVDWYDEPSARTFKDVSAQAGVTIGSRGAWCDFNGDGYDDICASGLSIFANRGDGTFSDVSEQVGVSEIPASGCVCADFDNDGYVDIFASLNSLTDYDRILKNNGDWTFTDVTLDLIAEEDLDYLPTEGAAWGDIDNDGYVDLYLANYELPGEDLGNGTQDKLYYNRGGESFQDVAKVAGMDEGLYPMCGRGVNWGDYDNDGDLDIFVSNYRLDANYLWENLGSGKFKNVAKLKGVAGDYAMAAYGHTIGSTWADFNHDGFLDLLSLNLAHPRFIEFSDTSALYINSGPPDFEFTNMILESGIFYDELHSNPSVGDYDNDGEWDAFLTAVYDGQESFLFRGLGGLRFEETSYQSGIVVNNGWGSAWSDYDNDGNIDLLVRDTDGSCLWQGTGLDAGGNHWLKVRTFGSDANYNSIGTRVEVTVGEKTLTAVVSGGSGTTNQDSTTLHFGLGENEIADEVKITWLGGGEIVLEDIHADQILEVTEGEEPDTGDDDNDDNDGDDDDDDGCGC